MQTMFALSRACAQRTFQLVHRVVERHLRLRPLGVHDMVGTFVFGNGSHRKERHPRVRRLELHVQPQQMYSRMRMTQELPCFLFGVRSEFTAQRETLGAEQDAGW